MFAFWSADGSSCQSFQVASSCRLFQTANTARALSVLPRDQHHHNGSSSDYCHQFNIMLVIMPVATVTTSTTDSNKSAKKRKAPISNGIYQKYYKGIFLPFWGTENNLNKWRQCKCNDTQKCQSILGKFKAIGDIRGTFAQVLSYSSLQPLTPGLLKKKDKLVRWMNYLRRTGKLMDFASINNQRQSTTTPTATRTRTQLSTVKQNLKR